MMLSLTAYGATFQEERARRGGDISGRITRMDVRMEFANSIVSWIKHQMKLVVNGHARTGNC
jgi:hypothetical protein